MCKVVPGDLGSCFGEVLDGGFGVDGVPGDDGVGKEGYAFALEVLVFGASASQLPLVSEDELPAESVLVHLLVTGLGSYIPRRAHGPAPPLSRGPPRLIQGP